MFLEILTAQIHTFNVKGFQGIEDVNSEIIYLGSNSVSLEVKKSFAFDFSVFIVVLLVLKSRVITI